MPKRSLEEKMDYYMKKMEKLKDKQRRKRRRCDDSPSSPSDQDDQANNLQGGETGIWCLLDPESEDTVQRPSSDETIAPVQVDTQVDANELINVTPQPNDAPITTPSEPVQPMDDSGFQPLDPELLSALGEATDPGPTWGQEIHTNLAQLWMPLLRKGMTSSSKENILKQYLVPSNCTLLQAPKLNMEISAAIAEMVRLRDKKIESSQQQLGAGITAVSRAMTSLLTADNKIEAIKTLSDGCRILCDLHHSQTQARIKMITPGLAKPFLNVIQDGERDETLFGVSLPEKIKASKSIEKQGLQIKKPAPAKPAPVPQNAITPVRQQAQGNWTAPPRYSNNRGGRGGQKKYIPSTRRTAAVTSTSTAQPKASQSRTRATTRQ